MSNETGSIFIAAVCILFIFNIYGIIKLVYNMFTLNITHKVLDKNIII